MVKESSALRPFDDLLKEWLRDPEEAAEYLNTALEDKDPRVFLLALRDVSEAHGGLGAVARNARVNRENLYRTLSRAGNPSLKSLSAVLGALGLRLSVRRAPVEGKKKRTA
jgi:probable addiction module antidote protein